MVQTIHPMTQYATECRSDPGCVKAYEKSKIADAKRAEERAIKWAERPVDVIVEGIGAIILVIFAIWLYGVIFLGGWKKK